MANKTFPNTISTKATPSTGDQLLISDGADGGKVKVIDYTTLVGPQGPAGATGATGPTGPQGPAGTNGTNGTSFVWRGTYNPATAYVANDNVSYNGSSYICILASTGNLPTNTTYWSVLALKGTDGAGAGDMLKATYDPTNINASAFDRTNHTGTQTASTISDIDTYTGTLTNKTLDDYTNFIHADGTHLRVKALENLTKGDVIMFVGFNSGESAIEVQKHNSSTAPAIGIMYSAITTGSFGMAISNGYLRDINTIAYPEGTILYPNTTGGFTTTPTINGTNYNQPIAYVLRSHAVNGIIMINIGPGHDLAPYVGYDNTTSGLVATNVQDAIDEIVASPSGGAVDSDQNILATQIFS